MKMRLSTKMLGGFGMLTLMVILGGVAGIYGINQLDKTLDYVTNNAWDAADGAMEVTIGIQQELIAVSEILRSGDGGEEDGHGKSKVTADKHGSEGEDMQHSMDAADMIVDPHDQLAEAKEFGGEAIARMLASGLIDEKVAREFESLNQGYQAAQDELLAKFNTFVPLNEELLENFDQFQRLMVGAEELGDGEVEDLESNPGLKISWGSGLRPKWEAADGAMESSIQLFTRNYHYTRLIGGQVEPEPELQGMREAQKWLTEKVEQIVALKIFKTSKLGELAAGTQYTPDTAYSEALAIALGKHIEDFEKAIAAYLEVAEANQRYQALARHLLAQMEIVEEAGDSAVEGQVENILQTKIIAYTVVAVVVLAALMLALVLTYFLTDTITQAFNKMVGICNQVTEGELQEIEVEATGDEVQDTLEAMRTMVSKLERENIAINDSVIDLLGAVSDLSDRDLTVKVPVNEDVTGPVADAMNLLATETAKVLLEIRNVSGQVADASNKVQEQGGRVNQLAANERAIVEDTMAKLTDASKSMTQVAQLAKACNDTAAKASASTQDALETVAKTASGMGDIRETIAETEKRIKRLGERSQEINGVVEIINNIAERTHVLALNASMQAAAAGDAGRGFAVVADEVQRLAESSRQSTSEIAGLVGNIQSETAETMATMNKTIAQVVDGTELAQAAGGQMEETQKTTSELANAVEQIFRRSITQAKVTEALRDQAEAVQTSTEETSSELEQQSSETVNLVEYSKRLVESVSVFKLPAA